MSSSKCCFLTCIQISQEADQVVWYSHLFQNFPQLIVIHIVKGFGQVILLSLRFFKYKMIITLVSQICKHVLLLFSSQQITPTTTPSQVISLNYQNHPIQGPITLISKRVSLSAVRGHVRIQAPIFLIPKSSSYLTPLLPLTLFRCWVQVPIVH